MPPSPSSARTAARQARYLSRWEHVRRLREAGGTITGIARELQISRVTARRLLAAPSPRVAEPPVGQLYSSALQPYLPFLEKRWWEGARNVSALYRELKERGYRGSRPSLARALQHWPRSPNRTRSPLAPSPCLSRRDRRCLCLSPPARLTGLGRKQLAALLEADPGLATGYGLLQRLREVVATSDVGGLNQWIGDAQGSGLAPFVSLASGLEADQAAVEMALRTSWSNGPVEGHVCRVKLLKRAGFGRAKVDLLRSRVRAA
jgi:transposase